MAGKVLMHGFVRAAVESEIVFIILKTGGGAEQSFYTRDFIDTGLDIEITHLLHFACAELGYFGGCEGRGKICGRDRCHD